MRNPFEPEITELDPETQAAVDEVCTALEEANADPWGSPAYLGLRFGVKWEIARKALRLTGGHECLGRLYEAVEQIVRNDPELFISATEDGITGPVIPRATIGQYRGRIVYEPDAEGEMRQVLQWPTGTYAGGDPAYERREDWNAA